VKPGRVLVADSHLGAQSGIHGRLEVLFETVLMVVNEWSLAEAVMTSKPDLVIADLSLPREGEADIVRRLLARHPDLRLISSVSTTSRRSSPRC
jgi:DNA-binding NarL/FixJ family response regulator